MKNFKRYDIHRLDNIEETPAGFLKFDVLAARTGIQVYRRADGSELREFRPPEEVFDEKAMESLRNCPLTNNHPKQMVNPSNAKDLMVGFTIDSVEIVDNKFLKTKVVVTDESTIEAIKNGKREVSMGYNVG